MTPTATAANQQSASKFASEVQRLLRSVLTVRTLPPVRALATPRGRFIVQPVGKDSAAKTEPKWIPLNVGGTLFAYLDVRFALTSDSSGQYMAVDSSRFHLISARSNDALIRYEFVRRSGNDPWPPPCAHWHIHAESGPITQILTAAGKKGAHDLGKIHFPVGGMRYRPGLEDFLELLIREVGIDGKPDAREAIEKSRADWRLRQSAVTARDAPEEAARVLRELNYTVIAPESGHAPTHHDRLTQF